MTKNLLSSVSRRNFLKAVEISVGAASLAAHGASAGPPTQKSSTLPPGKGITNNLRSPHMKLKSIDVDSAQWTSGLMGRAL